MIASCHISPTAQHHTPSKAAHRLSRNNWSKGFRDVVTANRGHMLLRCHC